MNYSSYHSLELGKRVLISRDLVRVVCDISTREEYYYNMQSLSMQYFAGFASTGYFPNVSRQES